MMAGVRQSLSNVHSTLRALLALTPSQQDKRTSRPVANSPPRSPSGTEAVVAFDPNVPLLGATCRGLTALPLGADHERVTDFVTQRTFGHFSTKLACLADRVLGHGRLSAPFDPEQQLSGLYGDRANSVTSEVRGIVFVEGGHGGPFWAGSATRGSITRS